MLCTVKSTKQITKEADPLHNNSSPRNYGFMHVLKMLLEKTKVRFNNLLTSISSFVIKLILI